ncbi:unnamed protein product [Nesidiocoris tenuis]|uniref:Uncharacterized protein n=1 Tax=Nesidiocoris tenuis TaxID=355587 RepID=A0A6H5H5W3_9HEMI|nr:unnamed protein product [Nesidiocoris tenuis]
MSKYTHVKSLLNSKHVQLTEYEQFPRIPPEGARMRHREGIGENDALADERLRMMKFLLKDTKFVYLMYHANLTLSTRSLETL